MDFIQDHIAYKKRLEASLLKLNDLELAKKRLTYIRWKVTENLDKMLFEFETNIKKSVSGMLWCPDQNSALETLNKQIKNFDKIQFLKHSAVKHLVSELDIKVPEDTEDPEVVVAGAKFIIANTGNFYTAFRDTTEYKKFISAKKIIVVAGIDSALALQNELNLARMMQFMKQAK